MSLVQGLNRSSISASEDWSALSGKPVFTLEQVVTQIQTQWGGGWAGTFLTQPTTGGRITYAIPTTPYASQDNESAGWLSPSAVMLQQARLVFQLWDDLIAPSLTELADPSAQIVLGLSHSTMGNGSYAALDSAGILTPPNGHALKSVQVWLSANWDSNNDAGFQFGRYGFQTMVHEIGHALGLSHPGLYDASQNRPITYAQDAVFAQDTIKYTVMSYFEANDDGSGTHHRDANGSWQYGVTPMLYDIAAAQAKYGADMTTRAGDTVYGFNSTAGRSVFDFTVNTAPIVAVWDAGGRDTLDLSGYTMSQSIDLRAGHFSDIGGMTGNFAIAFGVVIENAIGGTGNDRILGNAADNRLFGLDGDDWLNGGAGSNLLDGGAGYDVADLRALGRRGESFSTGTNGLTERAHASGTDQWQQIELALYADGRMVFDAEDPAARLLRLYEAALDRAPDQQGLNTRIALMQEGDSLTSHAAGIITSPEFMERFGTDLTHAAFVDIIYTNLFGTTADAANRDLWIGYLNAGVSRAEFVTSLAESGDARQVTAATLQAGLWDLDEDAAFIARLYAVACGRAPDLEGLMHWRGHFASGISRVELGMGFARSDEHNALLGSTDNATFVDRLYMIALGRAADAEGREAWIDYLASGASRGAVLVGFAESAELQALTMDSIGSENPRDFGIAFA